MKRQFCFAPSLPKGEVHQTFILLARDSAQSNTCDSGEEHHTLKCVAQGLHAGRGQTDVQVSRMLFNKLVFVALIVTRTVVMALLNGEQFYSSRIKQYFSWFPFVTMRCYILRLTQFVVLCWTGRSLQGQQMTDSSNDRATSYFFYRRPVYPRDCEEILDQCPSDTSSSVYLIKPDGYPEPFEVYCNNTNSGGWTVILRRDNGFVGFDRNWNEYKDGFGFLSQDFWIGHEKLSFVTNQKNYELRIDITNSNGLSCYLNYEVFRTSDEFGNFKITSLEQYSGNADDCISFCSSNMVPGDCNCQRTCSNPSVCVNTCSTDDTCVCPNGFYLRGEECVALSECTSGCSVDGEIVPEGGSYVNADCSRRGVCNNGQLTWNDAYSCNSNEVCEVRNNVRQCYSDDATDCLDIYNAGFSESDIYTISPANWSGSPFQVYCNMTDGGGWTVFQRRVDGTVDFYRNWTSYKEGFGTPDHENWLGNDKLYHLTNQKRYTLRIDFVNLDGSPYYAKFDFFRINDESDNYRLSQVGSYSGTAGYGYPLSNHLNYQFSTYDRDNDINSGNCAVSYRGAWWYYYCHNSNLNGRFGTSSCSYDNIWWNSLPGSNCNRYVEMKVRPF